MFSNEQVFRCLVVLTKVYDNLAFQSIINLCYVGQFHPLLGSAGAVQLLIDNLTSRSGVTFFRTLTPMYVLALMFEHFSDWPSSWVKALSLVCRAPANRMKLVDHGGIALLLNIIQTKDPSKLSCHLYALQILLLFYYNLDGNNHTNNLAFVLSRSTSLVLFIFFSALKILAEDSAIKIFIKLLKEYVELIDYDHQSETDVKKGS